MQAATPGPDPEKDASALEMRASLEEAVATLPENYRTVFVLRSRHSAVSSVDMSSIDRSTKTVR